MKLTKCSNLFFVGFKEKVEQQIDKKKIKNEGGFKLIWLVYQNIEIRKGAPYFPNPDYSQKILKR